MTQVQTNFKNSPKEKKKPLAIKITELIILFSFRLLSIFVRLFLIDSLILKQKFGCLERNIIQKGSIDFSVP